LVHVVVPQITALVLGVSAQVSVPSQSSSMQSVSSQAMGVPLQTPTMHMSS
jgi:hypothetical protein